MKILHRESILLLTAWKCPLTTFVIVTTFNPEGWKRGIRCRTVLQSQAQGWQSQGLKNWVLTFIISVLAIIAFRYKYWLVVIPVSISPVLLTCQIMMCPFRSCSCSQVQSKFLLITIKIKRFLGDHSCLTGAFPEGNSPTAWLSSLSLIEMYVPSAG